ncbi:MAG: 50S ribosomal protein L29 [Spirochaetales bacterium]|nr:50S ribosomal protein L29 [Spirochaetales bacterium]
MKNSFNDLTFKELQAKHNELIKKYRDIRFGMKIRHVDNPLEKRTVRRKLARVITLLHEFRLGIRKDKA